MDRLSEALWTIAFGTAMVCALVLDEPHSWLGLLIFAGFALVAMTQEKS